MGRRVRKLLIFSDVETDGGRDILRAAEVTPDPLLRRLYLEHAIDELRHGDLFRERGSALVRAQRIPRRVLSGGDPLPGGHGLDDLRIDGEPDHRLLAFLHVAEKSAAGRFAIYRQLVADDPPTQAIFEQILRDFRRTASAICGRIRARCSPTMKAKTSSRARLTIGVPNRGWRSSGGCESSGVRAGCSSRSASENPETQSNHGSRP